MESRYNIYFSGQLLEGYSDPEVRAGLGRLFKADGATLDRLFSGKLQLLKRNCDKATALRYKQALERAGAQPIIRPVETAVAPDTGGELVLAPAGTEVLRPGERTPMPAPQVEAPDLELAAPGTRLAAPGSPPPPPPDVSHLGLASPEEAPVRSPQPAPEPVPVSSEILLAPPGSDFTDCAPAATSEPALDLSGLALAPGGADLLEEKYRQQLPVTPPDTSKFKLEP